MEKVRINALQIENTKRVRAVQLTPSPTGLTVIGGRNGQGKTSVLDAIMYLLGGEKYRPETLKRQGSANDPEMSLTLSNGLIVTRRGKNSALTVVDPSGRRAGQTLLNEFVGAFALDLPKFLDGTDKERATALLRACGLEEQVAAVDAQIKAAEENRRFAYQEKDRARKYADGLPVYEDIPAEPLSAADLIRQQQEILARNGERMRWRQEITAINTDITNTRNNLERHRAEVSRLEVRLAELEAKAAAAAKTPEELELESTAELEQSLAEIEEINGMIRANQAKASAEAVAVQREGEHAALDEQVAALREQRLALFANGRMPVPGLTVTADYKVAYRGIPWSDMSGSEQMMVGAAIAAAEQPECGFVLIDKLEQLDVQTMTEFGRWLEENGLQAIATRVTTNKDECSIIIEDGEAVSAEPVPVPAAPITPAARPWEVKA